MTVNRQFLSLGPLFTTVTTRGEGLIPNSVDNLLTIKVGRSESSVGEIVLVTRASREDLTI